MPPYVQQPVDNGSSPAQIQQPAGNSLPPQSQQKSYRQQGTLHRDGCFNIQWLLFILGWLTTIPLIVAIFLPLCNGRPRFSSKSYLAGWVANIVLLILQIIAIIVLVVVVNKNNNSCGNTCTDQYGISYCC